MPSRHINQLRKWFLQSPAADWSISRLRELLIGALRQGHMPRHVAFVMDGNRRFARMHQIETVEGHNLGFEALARILEVCYKSGVEVVTVYAFSIENFKRSKYEVDALMDMAKVKLTQLAQHGDILDRYGASVRILGQKDLVRDDVAEAMEEAVALTAHNKKAILNVCFPYTGRDEIATAIRETVAEYSTPVTAPIKRNFSEGHITRNIRARRFPSVQFSGAPLSSENGHYPQDQDMDASTTSSTTLVPESSHNDDRRLSSEFADAEQITAETLDTHMFTANLPPVDLMIRTSGVERLSDFMLWQCHENTTIVFLECLWPEFDLWHFLPVLLEWQWRHEREQRKGREMMRRHAKVP